MTNAEVDAAIAVGADSVRAVRRATGAGQSCGSCVKRLSCLLSSSRTAADVTTAAEAPGAAPRPGPAAKPTTVTAPAAKPTPVPVAGLVAAAVEHLAGCPAGAVALG